MSVGIVAVKVVVVVAVNPLSYRRKITLMKAGCNGDDVGNYINHNSDRGYSSGVNRRTESRSKQKTRMVSEEAVEVEVELEVEVEVALTVALGL